MSRYNHMLSVLNIGIHGAEGSGLSLNTLVMELIIFVKSFSAGLHGGLINTIL